MSTETVSSAPIKRSLGCASNLILGLLVSVLSVLTAAANYAAYRANVSASDLESEGNRSLALSNTEYIRANQFVILDYTMFDGEFINRDVDDFAADYYKNNFSAALQSSIDRGSAFDDQYYTEVYKDSDATFNDAVASFDASNATRDREAGFQLSMLFAAVGLAFAAYGSLLDERNLMRILFALLSLIMLGIGTLQIIRVVLFF